MYASLRLMSMNIARLRTNTLLSLMFIVSLSPRVNSTIYIRSSYCSSFLEHNGRPSDARDRNKCSYRLSRLKKIRALALKRKHKQMGKGSGCRKRAVFVPEKDSPRKEAQGHAAQLHMTATGGANASVSVLVIAVTWFHSKFQLLGATFCFLHVAQQ